VRTHINLKENLMTVLINRDELRDAIDRGEVTVVDALPASYYAQQHLPGALNLYVEEARERALEVLPDKSAAIVTYCSNEACPNSEGVARVLASLGYHNVRKYREGIQDWVEAGLPTEATASAA
jgi:rhodanese-related sulfurtransferase